MVNAAHQSSAALSRADLCSRREQWLVRGTATKADLWRSSLADGTAIVVKDFSAKPLWLRPWGRIQIRREAYFLSSLAGIPGIPNLIAVLDRDAIVTEYIPGKPLSQCRAQEPRSEYVRQLRAILAAVHSRGVLHNDLRGRENVHVGSADPRVFLLDWAGAVELPPGTLRYRLLFPRWSAVDEAAVLKWKLMLTPDEVSEAERRFLSRFLFWRRLWPVNRKGTGRARVVR